MKNPNFTSKLLWVLSPPPRLAVLVMAPIANARDSLLNLPLEAALAKANASGKLAPGVKLFFGDQKYPKPPLADRFQTRTNKKTNFFNKTDVEGCEWAFLSAMISLTQYAQSVGGNAVVNIRSNYKNQPVLQRDRVPVRRR